MAVTQADNSLTSAKPQRIDLPPPHVFEILPPLHELLARVDAHQKQGLLPEQTLVEELGDDAHGFGAAYAEVQPLNPKDFPEAALEIKGRIRNALRELEKLPDMDRSIEQQEQEIAELHAKMEKQNAMLRSLAQIARDMEEQMQ
jgi:hypothetical protein